MKKWLFLNGTTLVSLQNAVLSYWRITEYPKQTIHTGGNISYTTLRTVNLPLSQCCTYAMYRISILKLREKWWGRELKYCFYYLILKMKRKGRCKTLFKNNSLDFITDKREDLGKFQFSNLSVWEHDFTTDRKRKSKCKKFVKEKRV